MKYLDYMIQDVDRLSDNINRILSLAKIENRTLKGEFIRRNPVLFIEQFWNRNKHIFQGCEVRVKNPSDLDVACDLDESLFEMMVMNLLTNAVKYNQSETPRIDVVFTQRGRKLHIDFADNGIGLPPRETKKIFRKFYQIGQAEDMSARGTGLGLYLVNSIARLHKGQVRATSPGVGKGSVISVILPLTEPASQA